MIFCETILGMANRYYTSEEVRRVFEMRLRDRTQVSVCRELGMKAQNLSVMVKGAPITGKVLDWLGFERVEGMFTRKRKAVRP